MAHCSGVVSKKESAEIGFLTGHGGYYHYEKLTGRGALTKGD